MGGVRDGAPNILAGLLEAACATLAGHRAVKLERAPRMADFARWVVAAEARAGDAVAEFAEKVRYCEPSRDSNRSRWPLHPAWRIVQAEAARFFEGRRSYADPVEVREANRAAHIEMLDAQLLGLMVSRAAAGGVEAGEMEGFFTRHAGALARLSREHPVGVEERMARAAGKYVLR